LREAFATLLGVGLQTQPFDEIRRARLGDIARDPPQSRDEVEIFDRRQLVVDHRLVRKPCRHSLGGDGIGKSVDAIDLDRPPIGLEQAAYHPQYRRLARAVGSQQREERADGYVEVYPIDRWALETLGETAEF